MNDDDDDDKYVRKCSFAVGKTVFCQLRCVVCLILWRGDMYSVVLFRGWMAWRPLFRHQNKFLPSTFSSHLNPPLPPVRDLCTWCGCVPLLYNEIKLHISFNSNHEFIIIIELFLSSHSPCKTRLNVIKVTRKNLIFLSIFGYYYHQVVGDGDNGNTINRSVHCRRTVNFPSTLLLPWRCNYSSPSSNLT